MRFSHLVRSPIGFYLLVGWWNGKKTLSPRNNWEKLSQLLHKLAVFLWEHRQYLLVVQLDVQLQQELGICLQSITQHTSSHYSLWFDLFRVSFHHTTDLRILNHHCAWRLHFHVFFHSYIIQYKHFHQLACIHHYHACYHWYIAPHIWIHQYNRTPHGHVSYHSTNHQHTFDHSGKCTVPFHASYHQPCLHHM